MRHGLCMKAVLCTVLCAAVAGSTAITAFAGRNEIPGDERPDYTKNHSFGIAGTFNNWGGDNESGIIPDIPMADADGDGIFTGVVCDLGAGLHEFKVRSDNNWDDSWGEYEYALGKTMNSQTNCSVSVNNSTDLIVTLDTRAKDPALWQINSYSTEELTTSRYGLIGTPTSWDNENDIPMYETAEGIYYGIFKKAPAGKHEFKVRAYEMWSDDGEICNWGPYEEDYESTLGSKSNVKLELEKESDIVVMFDTTSGDDEDAMSLWPISYMTISDGAITSAVYTGKEKAPGEVSEPEDNNYYKTEASDYLFFDNSETKWDTVYAYWWHNDYARTFDLENKDYGCTHITNEDGSDGYLPIAFPGTPMTNIPGTEIWQVRIPYNAQKIIFNSGRSDEEIENGMEGWQTEDLALDTAVHAGMIWTVNMSGGVEQGIGKEKTKYKYQMGSWSEYTGQFISEEIGTPKEAPEDPGDDPGKDPGNDPQEPSTAPEPDEPGQPGIIEGEGSTVVPDEPSGNDQASDEKKDEQNPPPSADGFPASPATGDSFPMAAAILAVISAAAIAATFRKHIYR